MSKRLFQLAAGFAVAAAALVAAPAAQALQLGDTVRDVVRVSGKDIPLPSGDYTVVGLGFADIQQPEFGDLVIPADYGPIRRIVLGRAIDGELAGSVEIVVNTLPHPDGWGIATDCTRTDIYATLTRYKSGWDVSCLWVQPVSTGWLGDEIRAADDAVELFAMDGSLVMPELMIEAGFRVANRYDAVDVRYQFAAMGDSGPATGEAMEEWLPAVIANNPDPLAKVQAVAVWASSVYPAVELGLRKPLDADAGFASPFDDVTFSGKFTDRAQRLAELTVLREQDKISQEEFNRQRAVIEAEAEPVLDSGWTYATVAGYKAFTYRVVVTAINAGIDYVFIGQPFAAGVLVVLQVVVNTTKFFFHEVMWQELFGVGPLQREQPRIMDFVVASAG